MAFWDRDDESEWEKHQKSKENEEPEKGETPLFSDEFKAYYKAVRHGLPTESGYVEQPGGKDTPLETFLSRIRRDKPGKAKESEEPEEPPEKCPWCGGDLVKGYLTGGRDAVYWRSKKPQFFGITGTAVGIVNEGGFVAYKTVWHCGACHKMVLDTLTLDPPLGLGRPNPYGLYGGGQASGAEQGDARPDDSEQET